MRCLEQCLLALLVCVIHPLLITIHSIDTAAVLFASVIVSLDGISRHGLVYSSVFT